LLIETGEIGGLIPSEQRKSLKNYCTGLYFLVIAKRCELVCKLLFDCPLLLAVSTQDLDRRFSTQLQTLSEMGFGDRQANIEGE